MTEYELPRRGPIGGVTTILVFVLVLAAPFVGFSEAVSGALAFSVASAVVAYLIGVGFFRPAWVGRLLYFAGPVALAAFAGGLQVFADWVDHSVNAGIMLGAIVTVTWAASGAVAYRLCERCARWRPPHGTVTLHFDETGYTGRNLLDPAQPVFVVASTNLTNEEAKTLIAECFSRQRDTELKHSRLCKSERGRREIVQFLRGIHRLPTSRFTISVAHKEYVMLGLLIDHWVEPAMRIRGLNAYERGGNIALCNVMHYALRAVLTQEDYREFLQRGQEMFTNRTFEAYEAFGRTLQAARRTGEELRELLDLFLLADEQLGGPEHLRRIPPRLTDLGTYHLLQQVCYWRAQSSAPLAIVHDRSSALARDRALWETILAADGPPMTVGQDRRTITFPLGVNAVAQADSRDHDQLQLADVVAGAFATYIRNRAYGDTAYRREYVAMLDECNLGTSNLISNWVWPTLDISPEELGTQGEVFKDPATYIANLVRRERE